MRLNLAVNMGREPDRKPVLMISYLFPPTAGSGVQRTAKFARYVPQCGWRPGGLD